jgi:hypothetical protein
VHDLCSRGRKWQGDRGTEKEPSAGLHLLYAILTTEPEGAVGPIHNKAMLVVLMTAADVERRLMGTSRKSSSCRRRQRMRRSSFAKIGSRPNAPRDRAWRPTARNCGMVPRGGPPQSSRIEHLRKGATGILPALFQGFQLSGCRTLPCHSHEHPDHLLRRLVLPCHSKLLSKPHWPEIQLSIYISFRGADHRSSAQPDVASQDARARFSQRSPS